MDQAVPADFRLAGWVLLTGGVLAIAGVVLSVPFIMSVPFVALGAVLLRRP